MNIMNDPKTVIIYPTELIVGAISDVFFSGGKNFNIGETYKIKQLVSGVENTNYTPAEVEITKIFNNAFDTFSLCYPSKNHFINEEIAIFINDTYKRHKLIVNNTIDGLHIGDINPEVPIL